MPRIIKQGKNKLTRESLTDIDALLNHERFRRMITNHLEISGTVKASEREK